MGKHLDLVGQKFGRLTVTGFYGTTEDRMSRLWSCSCSCGGTLVVSSKLLRNGTTKSCGCLMKDVLVARNKTHGMSKTPMYTLWCAMMSRCYNKNNKAYYRYGGIGITVCDRWHEYHLFLQDMGEKPEGLSLDRVDNSLGYSAANCRWASYTDQNNNRRDNVFVLMPDGAVLTLAQASRVLGLSKASLLVYHLKKYGVYKGVVYASPSGDV